MEEKDVVDQLHGKSLAHRGRKALDHSGSHKTLKTRYLRAGEETATVLQTQFCQSSFLNLAGEAGFESNVPQRVSPT